MQENNFFPDFGKKNSGFFFPWLEGGLKGLKNEGWKMVGGCLQQRNNKKNAPRCSFRVSYAKEKQ
jgi:hypothetical protein